MTCHDCINQEGYCGEPFRCDMSKGNPEEDYKTCPGYEYVKPWGYD